jgi:Family of unknown function (DUF5677)
MSLLTSQKVLKIIGKLETFINRSKYVPAMGYYRGKVLLSLLSKALTTGRAVCALVDAGFAAEAYGLSRTLIEIFFTARYISNRDVEERATQYVEYIGKAQEHLRDIAARHLPNTTVPPLREPFVGMARRYKSPHSWLQSHMGHVKTLAMEKDAYETDPNGDPLTAAFDYEHEYHVTSFYVHVTIHALLGHSVSNGETFRVRANISQQRNLGEKALFNVLTNTSKSFVCAFRGLRDDQPERILQEMHVMMGAYAKKAPDAPKRASASRKRRRI